MDGMLLGGACRGSPVKEKYLFQGENEIISVPGEWQREVTCSSVVEIVLTHFRLLVFNSCTSSVIEFPLFGIERALIQSPTEMLVTSQGAGMVTLIFRNACDLSTVIQCMESIWATSSASLTEHDHAMLASQQLQPSPTLAAYEFATLVREQWGGLLGDSQPWQPYDVEAEFRRLVTDDSWRITKVNEHYDVCPTYPAVLAVPRGMATDALLRDVARMRFNSRIPALSWRSALSRATITRCAQPKSEKILFAGRNSEDEQLVSAIIDASAPAPDTAVDPAAKKLVIIDARPMMNATFNMTKGGGYENVQYYEQCAVEFMDIANIHTMRESLRRLRLACYRTADWLTDLAGSRWMTHIEYVMRAGVRVASIVERGTSVLIHCSDGWDRTAQLSSLAMLLLDPYYRTMHGFQVLVEKEWVSFGHRFATRTGHRERPVVERKDSPKNGGLWGLAQGIGSLVCAGPSDERSPVFLQWLDCVWQVARQFPEAFEFNEHFLCAVADAVYSGFCGNFLCDSEKEREELKIRERTLSVWTLLASQKASFLNGSYEPSQFGVLHPSCSARRLVFWGDYFLRFCDEMPTDVSTTTTTYIRSAASSPILRTVASPALLSVIHPRPVGLRSSVVDGDSNVAVDGSVAASDDRSEDAMSARGPSLAVPLRESLLSSCHSSSPSASAASIPQTAETADSPAQTPTAPDDALPEHLSGRAPSEPIGIPTADAAKGVMTNSTEHTSFVMVEEKMSPPVIVSGSSS